MGWKKWGNANRVDSFIWHPRVLKSIFFEKKNYVFQLSYKIRSKGKFPSAEARTNDGTGCRPTDDSINSTIFNLLDGSSSGSIPRCEPTNYYHSGFLGLQAAIDFSWIAVSKLKDKY